eukprot:2990343-Prymnesium_polylepis.1
MELRGEHGFEPSWPRPRRRWRGCGRRARESERATSKGASLTSVDVGAGCPQQLLRCRRERGHVVGVLRKLEQRVNEEGLGRLAERQQLEQRLLRWPRRVIG